jgi:hypothetical protein
MILLLFVPLLPGKVLSPAEVMCGILGRLFLLLLLACDWAADPAYLAPAVQALAAPMASTECFCHSLAYRAALQKTSAGAQDPTPACLAPAMNDCCCFWTAPSLQILTPFSPTSLLYVFLSLRC